MRRRKKRSPLVSLTAESGKRRNTLISHANPYLKPLGSINTPSLDPQSQQVKIGKMKQWQ